MTEKQLVSVVVPVYNAELFLERCVESILQQTYSNIELVLVDDGSTDSSPMLCDAYAKKYANSMVIHQKNAGDSAARNAGIREMHGTFVFFVDADDYIPPHAIDGLMRIQIQKEADIVIGMVNTDVVERVQSVDMTSQEMAFFCIDQNRYMQEHTMPAFAEYINPGSQCMKIIRKSLITDHAAWFNEKVRMHHQDTLFSMKLYALTNRIVLTNVLAYYYDTQVPASMRKKRNPNKLREADILVRSMADNIEQYAIQNKQELFRRFYVEILYECWSEYFVHRDNQDSLRMRNKDLHKYIEIFEDILSFDNIHAKSDIVTYRWYQKMVLTLVLHKRYQVLTLLSWGWSRIKK